MSIEVLTIIFYYILLYIYICFLHNCLPKKKRFLWPGALHRYASRLCPTAPPLWADSPSQASGVGEILGLGLAIYLSIYLSVYVYIFLCIYIYLYTLYVIVFLCMYISIHRTYQDHDDIDVFDFKVIYIHIYIYIHTQMYV